MKFWLTSFATVMLLAGLAHAPSAQDKPAEPKLTPADARTTVVDFEFDGLIFVQTRVNGQGPFKFLFDSGATQSVVNERLAELLELEQHEMPGGVQGVGTAEASLVVLDSVDVGGFTKGKSIAASMNLDHMSGTLGYHLMGIIGQNVIKTMQKIEIDFAASKLSMTRYPEGEVPGDWQEEMIIRMLEGGGVGIPGLPGLPGGGDKRQGEKPEKPREKPKQKEPREEEFSAGPFSNWLLQAGQDDEKKTEAAPTRRSPLEGMNLSYTTGELDIPLMGKRELIPYWYLDVKINGKATRFMFDTGASMLLVLGTKAAETMAIPKSFTYPVKGIGTGQAASGLVEDFTLGRFTERDIACTIMDLPRVTDQIKDQVKGLGPIGDLLLPLIDQFAGGVDFDGIVGLPLATRFKKMIVNTKDRTIDFVPYGKDEVNAIEPYSTEDFVKDAVVRTWRGKAGKFGLVGDSVPLEEWKSQGLGHGGLMVESVEDDGPAAKAGIRKGDIITHLVGVAGDVPDDLEDADVEGKDVRVRDLPALLMWACTETPGREVTIRVRRGEELLELVVKLGDYGWKGTYPERFRE
jgi:predicted aspartyl protease